MKTPREILLAQHRAAGPKLDAIRRPIIAELNHQHTNAQSSRINFVAWCFGSSKIFWRELIFPNRRVWAGLATIWIFIFVVNFAERDLAPAGKISAAPPMMSFREQQRLLNELFADRSLPVDAEPPKTFSPKPRTEAAEFFNV